MSFPFFFLRSYLNWDLLFLYHLNLQIFCKYLCNKKTTRFAFFYMHIKTEDRNLKNFLININQKTILNRSKKSQNIKYLFENI